jgi:hypothetical protein
MTMDKTTEPATPRTLAQAHEAVAAIRPPQTAPLSEWLAYYQQSAAMYAEVAEIDRGHHHEALAIAERERQLAKQIKTRIHTSATSQVDAG